MTYHYSEDLEKTSRRLFPFYLGIVFLAPFPLGANRPWAWGLLAIAAFTLLAIYCFQFSRGKVRLPFISLNTKFVLFLLFSWVFYQLVQIIPLSHDILNILNPFRVGIDENIKHLGNTSSISIDRMTTLVEQLKSSIYAVMFLLTLLLVHRRDRLRTLLLTIIVAGVSQAVIGIALYLLSQSQTIEVFGVYITDSVKGTFINRNHFAGFINLSIAASVGLLIAVGFRERRKIHRGDL
ncbi:MAG: hypothetical protein R3240_13960, partial [Gammaproteobacteria bacterium]|nr:hypothetical protein [Gammaproteobacteria bacterium]